MNSCLVVGGTGLVACLVKELEASNDFDLVSQKKAFYKHKKIKRNRIRLYR